MKNFKITITSVDDLGLQWTARVEGCDDHFAMGQTPLVALQKLQEQVMMRGFETIAKEIAGGNASEG
jgi:hypothetical protein